MAEHMQWCYEHVNADLWLTSQSGGTDVASGFVGGVPIAPIHAGEIQGRCLGVDVESYDDGGQARLDAVGELVVRQHMPSMPLFFWNRSEEHTSELQSLMRNSYAVFCLKKKTNNRVHTLLRRKHKQRY